MFIFTTTQGQIDFQHNNKLYLIALGYKNINMISKLITFLALLSLLLPLTTAEQQNSTADKITSKLRKI